jgi:hypothetical protein
MWKTLKEVVDENEKLCEEAYGEECQAERGLMYDRTGFTR